MLDDDDGVTTGFLPGGEGTSTEGAVQGTEEVRSNPVPGTPPGGFGAEGDGRRPVSCPHDRRHALTPGTDVSAWPPGRIGPGPETRDTTSKMR